MTGKKILPLLLTALLLLGGCRSKADAGLIYREAKSNAENIKSCETSMTGTLRFTANGKPYASQTSSRILFHEAPFALRSVQSLQNNGTAAEQETYTVTQRGKLWFYYKSGSVWKKTEARNLDTSPGAQIDLLRMLNTVTAEKYVRQTALDGKPVHKLELNFSSEALRSSIEAIVSSTGMSKGSKTIVQTLLDSAPAVYGYAYIDTATGQFVRIEYDFTDALNGIFQKIDGSSVQVQVEKCAFSGDIGKIGSAPGVALPADAKSASSIEASG